MRWVQHCTAWDAEYPDRFLGLCIQRERWEADSDWENHSGEIIFRGQRVSEETAEREGMMRCCQLRGSLAEISWSCWDLSCLCHWLLPSSSKPEPEEKYCMRDMSESPLQLCIHSPLVNMACVWSFEVWWLSWNRPKNLLEYLSKRQFSKNNIGCHVRVYRLQFFLPVL